MSNTMSETDKSNPQGNPAANHSVAGTTPAKSSDFVMLDAVPPAQMGRDLVEDAVKKDKFATSHILIRGFLCTPFLAYATALSALLVTQGWPSAAAGLIFPVGYVMLATLGLEMATGSFSVMPIGMYAGRVKAWRVVRNWSWTLLGNLLGGLFFAWLLWFSLTKGGSVAPSGVLTTLAHLAEKKASYVDYGAIGWLAAVGMGVLCNWLVSLGPVFAKAARSVPGKVMLIWLPISTFFALGFEHTVVNMFVFPVGILSGAEVTIYDWWMWNQIPVTIGNILGALVFNATLWYYTHSINP
ncbi:formate/nitrite transporter [Nitrosococcus halophilus Nc 4]|uniref:Formate/nitrite transporter n=1 Tax=Nitrosococcus halophilus (strain Nc4) TaxID=472759 RepID=D5BVC1_NITHN|nr:formate/nitrite transporter family protein [Nitrosococcus halophilus]ADE13549.1 formate/nitrite transporter [Nitrosococcus halophilus Nc 4]